MNLSLSVIMPGNWSEKELAELCSEKDHSAQKELYQRYAAMIHMLCLRYLSKEDAQDMVHDIMIKVLEKISSFKYRGEGSLYAWIRRLALNCIVDKLRRQRYIFLSLNQFEDRLDEPNENDMMKIPKEILFGFISELPQGKRTVFNLYCIDDFSHKEIANLLNISEKSSAAILSKARNQLKKMIWSYLEKTK